MGDFRPTGVRYTCRTPGCGIKIPVDTAGRVDGSITCSKCQAEYKVFACKQCYKLLALPNGHGEVAGRIQCKGCKTMNEI